MRLFLFLYLFLSRIIPAFIVIFSFIWVPVVFAKAIKKRYGRIGIWRGILLLVACPMLFYIAIFTIIIMEFLYGG